MNTINAAFYHQTAGDTWTGRCDGTDPALLRWHQRVILVNILTGHLPLVDAKRKGIALIGFACDEGVKRNGGRTGSQSGPLQLRKAFGNLPDHFKEEIIFADLGNIVCLAAEMEKAQDELAKLVEIALSQGYQPLILGGGHEVTYGHFIGIRRYINKASADHSTNSIGIINFDAHFDLREPGENGTHSGTGFFQIARQCKEDGKPFAYLPIGIQQNSNTKHLFDTADSLNINYISAQQFSASGEKEILEEISRFIAASAHIYLSIDLDVFSVAVAPGVSAPAYAGIFPDHLFFNCLELIITSDKLISMDIAEFNPLYDIDNHTARLAAALAFRMITK